MLERIPNALVRWRRRELSDASAAALYFLYWQMHLHGSHFAARRSKSDARPDLAQWLAGLETLRGDDLEQTLIGWFARYQFKGVIGAVPQALRNWLTGAWSLALMEHIPRPRDVLALQIAGQRPVTIIADASRMLRPVLGKANGFAFLVHDLEHAHKFFADADLHRAQKQLFSNLADALEAGAFQSLNSDAGFAAKFDYLISDMNTHPAHSLQYLRAILIEASLRLEGKSPEDTLSSGAVETVEWLVASLGTGVDLLAETSPAG